MKNANMEQFLDNGWFNEATLYYKGYVYWCEAIWEKNKEKPMHFFVYRFPAKVIDEDYFERIPVDKPYEYMLDIWGYGEDDVREEFLKAKIFDGKSFWEVEKDLAWLDE